MFQILKQFGTYLSKQVKVFQKSVKAAMLLINLCSTR